MKAKIPDNRRRFFVKLGALGAVAFPLSQLLKSPPAMAEDLPKLDEADPAAQGLGYKHDATQVDTGQFPKRAGADGANQLCNNCQFYTGKADEEWGPCTIFPGKLVNALGWCNVWVKKAG